MGGAWDSTNTADGDVAVFAPIDIDHADRLGETIAEIAAVKAGIIKDGAAVVSARQDAAAEAVLRAAAAAQGRDDRVRGRGLRAHRAAARRRRAADLGAGSRRHLRRRVPAALRRAPGLQRRPRDRGGGVAHRRRRRTPIAGDILAEGLGAGDVARSPSARRHRPDRARRCRAQPARRARARHGAARIVRLRRVGRRRSASSPTRTPPASSRSSRRSPPTSSPPHRTRSAPSDADRIADLAEVARPAGHRPPRRRGRRRGRARVGRGIRSSRGRRRRLGAARGRGARPRRPPRTGRPGGTSERAAAADAACARRQRRARGAAESLATIVLGFESIVVFLGGLAIYGLKALPEPIAHWWGIVAGVVARAC